MTKLEKFVCIVFLAIFMQSISSCATTGGCGYWSSNDYKIEQTKDSTRNPAITCQDEVALAI